VMTQVFAAINHGLSEEYSRIELPHQEAKDRLLADAKFLHQKLSTLKNVGTPSGMLVTVVSEKSIPRANANVPPPATPTRRSSLQSVGSNANQRLRGLLSGKTPTFDKALPTPMRTSSPPQAATLKSDPANTAVPLPPPPPPRTTSPELMGTNKVPGGMGGDQNGGGALIPQQALPQEENRPPARFKQVEIPPSAFESERAPNSGFGMQTVSPPPFSPFSPDMSTGRGADN